MNPFKVGDQATIRTDKSPTPYLIISVTGNFVCIFKGRNSYLSYHYLDLCAFPAPPPSIQHAGGTALPSPQVQPPGASSVQQGAANQSHILRADAITEAYQKFLHGQWRGPVDTGAADQAENKNNQAAQWKDEGRCETCGTLRPMSVHGLGDCPNHPKPVGYV